MAQRKGGGALSFSLSEEHQRAIESIAGNRPVRLSGRLRGNQFSVDFVACNAAFVACNAPFTACNIAFSACNSAFTACNTAFSKAKK